MKIKIGILTFHCAHNYGAVLQCYALQEVLKSMGYNVEIINYRPKYLLNQYKKFCFNRLISRNPIRMLKIWINEIMTINKRKKRYEAFQTFIETRLNLTLPVEGKNIPSSFDVYIMGSDQIWNPQITKGFDSVYFGEFKFPKNGKKYIAYAASMEASSLNQESKTFYSRVLKNFDAISVRENTFAQLLQSLTNKKIETVLDPTLLTDSAIWDSIIKHPSIREPYVLVYQVRRDKNTKRIADNIAKQLHAKVIEITANLSCKLLRNTYQSCSPEEFLGWIKYASCVITTSFHGTAFSIIYNKSFYCLKLGKGDTRAASLLQELELENRMIERTSSPKFQLLNYEYVNEKIMNLRKKSYQFLLSSLNTNEVI